MPHKEIAHGTFGTFVCAGAITISLTEVEQWLRIASLLVGIGVGLVTGWSVGVSLYRKLKNKKLV